MRRLPGAPLNERYGADGNFSRAWHRWFDKVSEIVNERMGVAGSYVPGNLVIFNSEGGPADSGKAPPDGAIVGTTDAQTLANKTLTTPTIANFTNANHDHRSTGGGGVLDHGLALGGLIDDDHTQYALLAGRSGGQALTGGTGASQNLTLSSTSSATKGDIQHDSRLIATGAGRLWRDFNKTLQPLPSGAAAPNVYTIAGITYEWRGFAGSGPVERVEAVTEIDHDWAEATAIKPHVHLVFNSAAGGVVKLSLTYVWSNVSSNALSQTTISATITSPGIVGACRKLEFPDIAGTGFAIGSQFRVVVSRDSSDTEDTYSGAVLLDTIGVHGQVDSNGSREVGAK